MDRLKLFKIGYSWGGVSSLVVTVDPKERRMLVCTVGGYFAFTSV